MLQFKVFDVATSTHIQTIQVVNAEFYLGVIIGLFVSLIFWNVAKGMVV